MLVLGIIFTSVVIIILVIIIVKDIDEGAVFLGIFMALAVLGAIGCFGANYDNKNPSIKEISTKDLTMSIEVKTETVNGIEILRDTVYIFTPKK